MSGKTYRNPIIPGYAPDPTCAQHRGTYYLMTSSFLSFPALPIYTSTDLFNWTLRSNVVHSLEQLPRLKECGVKFPIGGGMWAPSLRFRPDPGQDEHGEGEWFVTVTLVFPQTEYAAEERWENLLFRSRDPLRWGKPVKFAFPGYDTSLAWDDSAEGKGQAYVQGAHYWRVRPEILSIPLDLDTGKALGPPVKIWSGEGGKAPEAPHAYHKDGKWWLVLAEGGTESGHRSTIASSSTISAPHSDWTACPSNPILTSSPPSSTSTIPDANHFTTIGHCDLFRTPAGEWMAVALATRDGRDDSEAPMGRETVMVPVSWPEGEWPKLEKVKAEMSLPSGAGEPKLDEVEGVKLLEEGATDDLLAACSLWRSKDPSDSYAFPPHLLFLRLPTIDSYALTPTGTLRLTPSPTTLIHHPVAPFSPYAIPSYPATTPEDRFAGTCTFLGRRQTDLEGSMNAMVSFAKKTGSDVETQGGLAVFLDETHHFLFGISSSSDSPTLSLRSTAEGVAEVSQPLQLPSSATSTVVVELKVEWTMSQYTFHYRVPSSSDSVAASAEGGWTELGQAHAKDVTGGFTGVILGVWASLSAGQRDQGDSEKGPEFEVREWKYTSQRKY